MSGVLDASVIGSCPVGGVVGASCAGECVGASFSGGATGRRWPETLRARPCALDDGHPWPPTFRPAPPRHPTLNVAVNLGLWSVHHQIVNNARLLLGPLQRAAVEAVWGWGRSCGTVGGHGSPPPSLHGRTRGGSRNSGPTATLPAPNPKPAISTRANKPAARNVNQ